MKFHGYISQKKGLQEDDKGNPSLSGKLSIPSSKVEKDYNELFNKPQIEGVELMGDKSFDDLGMVEASALDILNIFEED